MRHYEPLTDEYGQPLSDAALRSLYREWEGQGTPKSHIERRYGDVTSNGQRISANWRDRLGIETVKPHPLVLRCAKLESLLELHGIAIPGGKQHG